MFKRKLRLSRSGLIVIAMCVLVLLSIFFLSYFNLQHISTLKESINDLSNEDSSVGLLRKCYQDLALAENHYQVYVNTGDSAQKQYFLNDIGSAINDCNRINAYDGGFSKKIHQGVVRQIIDFDHIDKLRSIADSVKNSPDRITIVMQNQPIELERMDKSFFKNFSSSSTDTLKLFSKRKKMNFFQKLGYLFTGKDGTQTKTEFVKGSPEEKRFLDSLQHISDSTTKGLSARLRSFYQKSLDKKISLRQELSEKEADIAETNLLMIAEIDSKINDLRSHQEEAQRHEKLEALSSAQQARRSIKKISLFSLSGILVLISLLVYNIYRTNKYEQAIIEAKTSAQKLALMKGRFLSNMSHEIRSPLTAIMGFTEQIANNEYDQNNGKYLDAIKVSSNHLLNTVNDILDFSKLDAGKLTLTKQSFSLKKALDEVAFAFSLEADKKGISLISRSGFDENLTVHGDAHRFKQILYNLVSNAVKFKDRGTIEISASAKVSNEKEILATVAVKDSGIGILPTQFSMIFQEFAQVDMTKNSMQARAIKGTGLGLPISKMLTELQGGNITVESEISKGSVFTITIPYELSRPGQIKPEGSKKLSSEAVPLRASAKNILVVEDNELNVMLISLLLERMGHRFDIATDGELALQLYRKNNYKLILTDINIPKITGAQLAETIRKDSDPGKSRTKIVALTATLFNDDFESYYQAGINKILAKPFKEEEFRDLIESMLNVAQLA